MRNKVMVLTAFLLIVASLCSNVFAADLKKDTLTVGTTAEPSTLDLLSTSDLFCSQYQVFDNLLEETFDGKGTLLPGLAEKWEVSSDGKELKFYIRKNVKFHNGDILTADDVVFTLNRAIKSPFTQAISSFMNVAEAIDAYTVRVKLNFAYGSALACLATPNFGIQNKRAVETDAKAYGRKPIGTGPYILKEWLSGDKIVYTSFPGYFRGPAPIKNVIFKIIPDASTQVVALERGEVDVLDTNPSADARNSFKTNPKLSFYECNSNAYLYIAFNNANGFFSNPKVREAVSYAVDRKELIEGAKNGVGEPVEAPMLAMCADYPQGYKANPLDIAKGKKLLAEAGYPQGFTVKMKTIDNPVYLRPTEVLQQQLGKIGIKIEIETLSRTKWMADVLGKSDFEITFWAVVARVIDADYCQYILFHSSNIGGKGNYINVNIPELDKVLDRARVTQDPKERKELYAKSSQLIKENTCIVPLFSTTRISVSNKSLKGVTVNPANINKYYYTSW